MQEIIIYYNRSTFSTETQISVKVPVDKLKNNRVPQKKDRNGEDIFGWLKQFPEHPMPTSEPNFWEDRGGEWTSHYLAYYY